MPNSNGQETDQFCASCGLRIPNAYRNKRTVKRNGATYVVCFNETKCEKDIINRTDERLVNVSQRSYATA